MANILIGLGGTGGKILKAFRQRLWTEYAPEKHEQLGIGFIYVDSSKDMLDPTNMAYETIHGNCCFEENDFVDIKRNCDVDVIFASPSAYPRIAGVLGNVAETQTAVSPVGAAADQKRRAGRILFAANIDAYLNKLASTIGRVHRGNERLDIYIFAGLAGGTGSGCILDTIIQTRKWLFEHNYNEKQFQLTAYCQIPENTPQPNWDTGRYKANGYGALTELNNLFTSHYTLEWNDKVNKPAYDVTSLVNYGRLYLSYENPTPDNVQKGRIPQELKIAGGLVLYSNKNENGYTIDGEGAPERLAQIVANFIYTWIFMPAGDAHDEFGRFVSFENLSNNRDEYDETVNNELGNPIPVRTRAIGSFGLKRIVVPEIKIKEHISYILGSGALAQVKFGNWNTNTGYLNEPVHFDAISYVNDEGRRESWKLSRSYLFLKKHILGGDNWQEGEFNLYWNPCIDAWQGVARNARNEFAKLIELCRGGYDTGFRNTGVEEFFSDKARAIDRAYALEVLKKLENYLFEQWSNGRLSLSELEDIALQLCVEIHEETEKLIEREIPACEQRIRSNEQAINSIVQEYLESNLIVRAATFNNRYNRVVELSKVLYSQKTELAAMRIFAHPLCLSLENLFHELHQRICGFNRQFTNVAQLLGAHIVTLTDIQPIDRVIDRDGTEQMELPTIEFFRRRMLLQLEERLLRDKERMDSICNIVRNGLVSDLKSEGRFINRERINMKSLTSILLGSVYEQIGAFHSALCTEEQEKVLGMPVLKRLYQKFVGNPLGLQQFAKEIVVASGVFSEIDMLQIQQNNANTPMPQIGMNILMKRILINLPVCEEPELVGFCNDLRNAVLGAIPGGVNAGVVVDTNSPNKNEISVMTLVNGFPMRAIGALPMLKAEYDRLLVQEPKNRIVLHTEGKSDDYRTLFARPPKTVKEICDEVMPQLIVSLGLEAFLKDVASEEYGECQKDFFGNDSVIPWGYCKFTEIPYDERLIKEKETTITKMYKECIANEFANVDISVRKFIDDKKKEVQGRVMTAIGGIMKTENPSKASYADFVKWTEAAVSLIMNYNPNVQ